MVDIKYRHFSPDKLQEIKLINVNELINKSVHEKFEESLPERDYDFFEDLDFPDSSYDCHIDPQSEVFDPLLKEIIDKCLDEKENVKVIPNTDTEMDMLVDIKIILNKISSLECRAQSLCENS